MPTNLRFSGCDPWCDYCKDDEQHEGAVPENWIPAPCPKCGPTAILEFGTQAELAAGLRELRNAAFACSCGHIEYRPEFGAHEDTSECETEAHEITCRVVEYDGSFEVEWNKPDPGCKQCRGTGQWTHYRPGADLKHCPCRLYDLTGVDRMELAPGKHPESGRDCKCNEIATNFAAARQAATDQGCEVTDG